MIHPTAACRNGDDAMTRCMPALARILAAVLTLPASAQERPGSPGAAESSRVIVAPAPPPVSRARIAASPWTPAAVDLLETSAAFRAARRRENVGIGLTISGGLVVLGGLVALAAISTRPGGNDAGSNVALGVLVGAPTVAAGLALGIPGVVLWSSGRARQNSPAAAARRPVVPGARPPAAWAEGSAFDLFEHSVSAGARHRAAHPSLARIRAAIDHDRRLTPPEETPMSGNRPHPLNHVTPLRLICALALSALFSIGCGEGEPASGAECEGDFACNQDQVCDPERARCIDACKRDDECGDGGIRVDGRCNEGCRQDDDCAAVDFCEGSINSCFEGCREDADCSAGEVCDGLINACSQRPAATTTTARARRGIISEGPGDCGGAGTGLAGRTEPGVR